MPPTLGSAPVSALSYIDHVADYMHTNQRLQDVPSPRQFPTEVPMYLPIKGWPGAKLGIKSVSNKSTLQDYIQKTNAPFWLKQLLYCWANIRCLTFIFMACWSMFDLHWGCLIMHFFCIFCLLVQLTQPGIWKSGWPESLWSFPNFFFVLLYI